MHFLTISQLGKWWGWRFVLSTGNPWGFRGDPKSFPVLAYLTDTDFKGDKIPPPDCHSKYNRKGCSSLDLAAKSKPYTEQAEHLAKFSV